MKKTIIAIAILFFVPLIMAGILSNTIADHFGLWWSVIMLIMAPVVIINMILAPEIPAFRGTAGRFIVGVFYIPLFFGLILPLIKEAAYDAAPATVDSLSKLGVDADYRTSDSIQPVGTDGRIIAKYQREYLEHQISVRYAAQSAEIRRKYDASEANLGEHYTLEQFQKDQAAANAEYTNSLNAVNSSVRVDIPSPSEDLNWTKYIPIGLLLIALFVIISWYSNKHRSIAILPASKTEDRLRAIMLIILLCAAVWTWYNWPVVKNYINSFKLSHEMSKTINKEELQTPKEFLVVSSPARI